ncbi:polysaccharide biosynthesis C-terminal domain-containing protein, partial [Enterococcus hirae]|nr:polysaccharide biosynthesis C-terminal domain-containing protein [Enterococcus hirae]
DINWFFFGMEEFRITVIRNTLVKILSTVAIFLFVKKPSDINIYTLILSLSFLVSQILLWPYLIKKVYFYKPKLSEVVSHIKPNLFLFLTVVAVSIYRTMDKIMLGYLTDNLQVGYFESSEKIIQVPMLLITSLGMIMLPRMSNLANNKKSIESKKLINKSILFAMFLSSSLCFGIMGVASEFVPLFFGKGFETCIYLFWILLPSCLFLAFANVVRTQYVIPNKLDQIYVKSVFIGAIVNFLSNSLLIKNYYSIGAAIGTLLAEIAVCVYISYKIRNDLDISYMVWISVPFIISGIIMFSVLLNVKLPFESLSSIMLGKILIGVPIYMGSLLLQIIIIKLTKKIV